MGKTLYVTDLDGTLLNRESRVSPVSIEIINRLVAQGMLFTYATARSLISASVAARGLSVDIPVIAYNGVFIMRPSTGEILSREGFAGKETDVIRTALEEHGAKLLVYSLLDGEEKVFWVAGEENEGIRDYLARRKGDRRLHPVDSRVGLYQGDMFYFTCIGGREELAPLYEKLSRDGRLYCTFKQELYRPEYWLEIMPARATKAYAVKKLKKLWGCDRVVSFGDAANDIPMFEASDEAYAVENAAEELKVHATGIIGSNENDGVARWLEAHACPER